MDDRTRILISLGASVAVNCMPCFEHYFRKATAAGLDDEEVALAVDTARQVKKGADVAIRNFVSDKMTGADPGNRPNVCSAEGTCCG